MSKETTLIKVKNEIDSANLGKARDRLHGHISADPNDLDLRPMLAEIYFKLQFPAMAGRYWYLEENRTEEMQKCCEEFEKSCGLDPMRMLLALKFKGDVSKLSSDYAKGRLLDLVEACKQRYNRYPEFGLSGRKRWKSTRPIFDKLIPYGCLFISVIAIILVIIGLVTVLRLAFNF